MPAPEVDPESSVLSFKQWERWEHVFSATNSPTSWSIASGGFPSGITFQKTFPLLGTAATDMIEAEGADWADGSVVVIGELTGGSGLAAATRYFVRDSDEQGNFRLAATLAGAAINFTTDITAGTIFKLGHMAGAATLPGISKVRLIATNGTGDSPAVQFVIGIEPAAAQPDSNGDLVYDMGTNLVRRQTSSLLPDTSEPPDNIDAPLKAPWVMTIKEGDDIISRIRLVKSGTILDLSVLTMDLVLKEFESETEIPAGNTFLKVGTGVSTSFLLYSKVEDATAAQALANKEDDSGTFFFALAEISLSFTNPEAVGPAVLVRSSQTFRVRVDRDLKNNA